MKTNIKAKASQNHQNSLNRLASEKLKQIDLFSAIWLFQQIFLMLSTH